MSIVNTLALESNRQIKINFDGGDLSSDAGLLLIKEFISKLGIDKFFDKAFKTNDPVFESVLEKDALASQHTVDRKAGRAFNFHYQSNGYHPFVCYDGMTGDLIKIQFRDDSGFATSVLYKHRLKMAQSM